MSPIPEDLKQGMAEALKTVRDIAEKQGTDSATYKEAFDKADVKMKEFDDANQKFTMELQEAKKVAEEQKEKITDLEGAVRKAAAVVGEKKNWRDGAAHQEFKSYIMGQVGEKEFKTLRTDDTTAGGALITHEFATDIIKQIVEVSPIDQLARTRTVSKKTLEIPVRTGRPSAQYEGEAQTGTRSESSYGTETLHVHRLQTSVRFTEDMAMDFPGLESEISADVAEAFAEARGLNFVSGDGAKKPEGFLTNADVLSTVRTSTVTGAGNIESDDLILMAGDLKTGYNATYGFNRLTLAFIRTLKGSTNDHYLWQNGLAPDAPATIAGSPYILIPDMPDLAAGSLSVVFADFFKGYTITNRTGLRVVRDNITEVEDAITKLTFQSWNHGQVTLPEAFQLLAADS